MDQGKELINQVLFKRNLPENFLHLAESWHDFNRLPSSSNIIQRINQAIHENQNILIWGDQDVDGITSVAILKKGILPYNHNIFTHIPDRAKQGIGFNLEILKNLVHRHQPSLVITVDCCSRDVQAAKYLNQTGIDFIITDHHEVENQAVLEFKHCQGFMNCKRSSSQYPFAYLAGCGISLKIALNFSQTEYLWVLAMLGTIADRVPLLDENRTIVKKGLKYLNKNPAPPLKNLFQSSENNFPMSTKEIKQYLISPLASDFIDQSRSAALELLTNSSSSDYASNLRQRSINWWRQREQSVKLASSLAYRLGDFIFCYLPDSSRSLLGTIANYLSINYCRPALVIGNLNQGYQTVEVRTVAGEILSVLDAHSSFFSSYGGHLKAAGATIPDREIDRFKQSVKNYKYPLKLSRKLRIDLTLTKQQAVPEILEALSQLGPFGQDFPEISVEIPEVQSPSPVDNCNIFLLDELGRLRPAEIIDDIWDITCSPSSNEKKGK